MLARLTVVALAVLMLAPACGGSSRRGPVSRYLDRVNTIETELAKPMLALSKANRAFARGHAKNPTVLAKIERSQKQIHRLGRKLAAVPPPPEVRHLRALLLDVVAREEALAAEVEALVVFLPAFNKALAPLGPASTELKRDLSKKSSVTAKIEALDRYRGHLDPVVSDLRRLAPPPSSRPVWAQQIRTLELVGQSAGALATALREKRAAAIPKLLHAFDLAAVNSQSTAAQRARIAAVVAYNKRVKHLSTLGSAIAREESRLEANVN